MFVIGVGYAELWEIIDLVVLGGRVVVADIVGVLFGEPDGVVAGNGDAHDAGCSVWWRHLLEGLCAWVKDGQVIVAHLAEPDAAFMVDSGAHDIAVWLGK